MDELLSLKWKNHCSTFLQVLVGIRKNQTYSDVTLACSGKFYNAHKMVLTACSDYFKEIFEYTDCKKPVIVLKGINCEDLENLLDYMYIGEVNVKQSDITSLVKTAECLQIRGLAIADDEPLVDNRYDSTKQTTSMPNTRNKRKAKDHSISSEAKQLKRDTKLSSINENETKPNINKIEDIYVDEPLFIKEEIETIDDFNDGTLQQKLSEKESKLHSYSIKDQPSSFQSQDDNFEKQSTESSPAVQDDSSEWTDDTQIRYSSFNEVENETNKIKTKKMFRQNSNKMCSYCLKKFDITSKLKQHLRAHTGEKPYACRMCSFKCSIKANLKTHERHVHEKKKPFSCDICSYKCSLKSGLEKHITVHTGEKPYSCEECAYQSKAKLTMHKHINKFHPSPYKVCD